MIQGNIFDLDGHVFDPLQEALETLFSGSRVTAEKIISRGHVTETGKWYDQHLDEWVVLLQGKARLEFENGEILNLSGGDYILLPARKKHRVTYTSHEPPCIWLAVHGELKT